MTDRTHPDSGSIISSSDILLHDAKTALMYEELRAAIDDGHESMTHADALAEIAAIRAENTMLRQHAAKQITDATLLTGISPRNGGVDIGLKGGACQLLAEAFFDQFVESGAVNFLEIRLESSTRMPGKAMTVTMQLADGATPGQKIAAANARIAELEAQLEAIGAGGVSGPLMGRAPEGITRDDTVHGETYFTAADMASAAAQGFRDGVASVAASAPAPSGHIKEPYTVAEIKAKIASNDYSAELLLQHAMLHLDRLAASAGSEPVAEVVRNTAEDAQFSPRSAWPLNNFHDLPLGTKLYTHPSPPEGMVGGWISVDERLPEPNVEVLCAGQGWGKPFVTACYYDDGRREWYPINTYWTDSTGSAQYPTHWMPLPPPPTTSAGSRKGE